METIAKLLNSYKTKQKTPFEVVTAYLEESKKRNKELNAYVTFNDKHTLELAKKTTTFDKPLSGIPIAIKDNFCTDGLRTTASAKLLDNFIPPYDATVIKKLKDAGAIILGKTNMDAWAHGSSTETSDYGATNNPYDTSRLPGGSSGGSAAAVASGITPFAIGSETAGSIRQPAAWCGIVGLKPTYGRVSRYGVIAMGSSLDCPGPMAKTVEDAATLLSVIAGKDTYDATTSTKPLSNYVSDMKEGKKMTIGISDDYLEGVDKNIVTLFNDSVKVLEKNGHTIKKIKLFPPKYAISVYTIVQRAEVSSNLARFDGIRYGFPRTSFATEAKRRMMFGAFTLSVGYYDAFYVKAQKVRTLIMNDFKKAFADVDCICAPTTPVTALKHGEPSKNPMFGEVMDVLIEPSTMAGLPAVNMPIGLSDGLPVGMQILAPWFEESRVLDLAHQFEQITESYKIVPENFYEL
ncbi:MAG: Asp-tRNA(Asn)/Glu-tRNA(Gln) amidotransferase subunit GatA [Patescibacteria group bacterium]|jgi:aspartyl-tRNA(Asn)/glutamyl-tRNA(Gln) amidotransferase subunit A